MRPSGTDPNAEAHWACRPSRRPALADAHVRAGRLAKDFHLMLMPLRRPRRDQKLAWLRTIPGFAVLSNAEIAELAATADRTIVLAGARLVTQGGRGLECFVIADGVAEVRRDGVPIAEIGPGTVVGELALLDATLRNADVYALTDLEVAVFDVRSFLRALGGNAQFDALVKRFAAEHRDDDAVSPPTAGS